MTKSKSKSNQKESKKKINEFPGQNMKEMKEMKEIKIGELFDIEGELAILELHETYGVGGTNKHYTLKLEMVGRETGVKFSEEDVKNKKLPFIPFDRWE